MESDMPKSPIPILTRPESFLAPCPKFRILVLGNPESTKQELFSKVFGVDLEKVCQVPSPSYTPLQSTTANKSHHEL